MAITKRLSDSYLITTPTTAGSNITLTTSNVIVNGNLLVSGITTTISTTDTAIKDNVITLNSGETGPGVTLTYAGISVDRGPVSFVASLRWYEPTQSWQLTNDGSVYGNIQTTASGAGSALIHIVDDLDPMLGANLNTNGKTLFANVGRNVIFEGNVQLNNTITAPTVAVANATVVYSSIPAAGTSGVYVLNGSSANEELVTKRRAFGFSLIL